MNRFKVAKNSTSSFENLWNQRESYLHELEGFKGFYLLRGPERNDHIIYASHTVWQSYDNFHAWTKSEQFKKAHTRAGDGSIQSLYKGAPEFEGFSAVQEIDSTGKKKIY